MSSKQLSELKRVKQVKSFLNKAKQVKNEIPLDLGKAIIAKYGIIKTKNDGTVKKYRDYNSRGKQISKTNKHYDVKVAKDNVIGINSFEKHYYIIPKLVIGNDNKLHPNKEYKLAELGKALLEYKHNQGDNINNIDEAIAKLKK